MRPSGCMTSVMSTFSGTRSTVLKTGSPKEASLEEGAFTGSPPIAARTFENSPLILSECAAMKSRCLVGFIWVALAVWYLLWRHYEDVLVGIQPYER